MAENLDDGEFWLPPRFLNDDDTPKRGNVANNDDVFDAASRNLFPHAFGSCGSSETESSDEEDPMVELTRLLTHQLELSRKGSGSPQSTLCALGNGCGCGKGSGSSSSPNSVCHVTSQSATWDLLHAAAGEVERMRKVITSDNDGRYGFCCDHTRAKPTLPGVGFYARQQHQLQVAQFQILREQQMAKQQQQRQNYQMVPNRVRSNTEGFYAAIGGRNVGANMGFSPAAWPSLNQAKQHQQQYGFGMRAVFLDNSSGKRGSTGTGVFLPRRVDTPAEPRKKPGCSGVLVPARVVQALNLKVEDLVGGQSQPHNYPLFTATSNMENASINPRIRGNVVSQQRRNLRTQPAPLNHEIRLPQEWTY